MGTMGGERMSFTTLERMSYRGGECILKQRTSDTNIVRALLSMQVRFLPPGGAGENVYSNRELVILT